MTETNNVTTEIVRRVYDNTEGVYIEVRPDSEGFGCVEVVTVDKKSQEWFGPIRFNITKKMAKALGAALIQAAEEK